MNNALLTAIIATLGGLAAGILAYALSLAIWGPAVLWGWML